MPKKYKWSSFSLAELRKVAKAYKDHTKVPAPSKMTKKDLIVLLDKHLILDKDTAEIKVKATMESSLGEVERMPKKMKMTKVPSAPAERSPEPPAEKPKEMTTVEHIQALPKELQDLIFENLPKKLIKEVEEGTPAEKDAKFLKDNPFDFFEDNYRMKSQLVGWDIGPKFGKDAGAIFKFDLKRIMDDVVRRLKEYGGVRPVEVQKIGRRILDSQGKPVKEGGYYKYGYNYAITMDTPLYLFDDDKTKTNRYVLMLFLLDKNGNPIIPVFYKDFVKTSDSFSTFQSYFNRDELSIKNPNFLPQSLPYLKHFRLDKKEVDKWNKIKETKKYTDDQLDYQNYFKSKN